MYGGKGILFHIILLFLINQYFGKYLPHYKLNIGSRQSLARVNSLQMGRYGEMKRGRSATESQVIDKLFKELVLFTARAAYDLGKAN